MYAGHAALALLAKRARPRISLAVLVPVAFAPDWIEWILGSRAANARMLSHGLISVFIGALTVALVYWIGSRRTADAGALALLYLSHWLADLITGLKPTWPGGPNIGLLLYDHPRADVVVESVLILIAAWAYQQMLGGRSWGMRLVAGGLVAGGLIGMQIGFIIIQTPTIRDPLHQIIDSTPFGALSLRREDDILVPVTSDSARRMALARFADETDSSESWQTTEARLVS